MVIIAAYNKALQTALDIVQRISIPIDTTDDEQMLSLIKTSIGTKFVIRWSELMCRLALQAVRTVSSVENGIRTVDIKRYARVEKVPGGEIEQSRVLNGVMLNKDITHPQMRRRIQNPRIILLDCPLEYKKGESQTNIEISKEADYARINQIEEEQVKGLVDRILEFKPDLVITEKGVSGMHTSSAPIPLAYVGTQTMRSISLPRPTSRPSDVCASQTTTVLLALWAQPSSTASKTFVRLTSEQNVASLTSKSWATSACLLPRCGLAISD